MTSRPKVKICAGIDVCFGVESVPGIKDRALLKRLFVEVRHGQGTSPS